MTRRIIRSFAGETESYEPMRETYSPAPSYRPIEEQPPIPRADPIQRAEPVQRADTTEMLARVARSESETQDIYRRIETQLGSLGRRLEATERGAAENNRAMSKAATEINIAAREQAQAFDQLSSHVVHLAGRLERVEQGSGGTDGMKEAVKSLHQGMSRLTDQISTTAKQSASQIESLAGNLETLAGKVADVRTSAEGAARTMEQRMAMLDERVRVVERVAHSSADALDKALENMEARHAARSEESADIHRRVGSVEHLNDALDRITSRFASSEAQTASAIARMEDSVLKLEGRGSDPAIDRRLNSIERTLGDIVAKFEGASATDETIRRLAQRLDTMEHRHEELADVHAQAQPEPTPAFAPIQPSFTPQPSFAPQPAFAPQPSAYAPTPVFDAPPFPDLPPQPVQAARPDPFADAFAPVFPATPAGEAASPFGEFAPQGAFAPQPAFDAPGFVPSAAPPPPVTNESFLAAARRSAQAAAVVAETERSRGFGGFSWGSAAQGQTQTAPAAATTIAPPAAHIPVMNDAEAVAEPKKRNLTRYLLIGAAALILILVIASVILSQRAGVDQAERHNGIGTLFTPKTPANTAPKIAPVPYMPMDQSAGAPQAAPEPSSPTTNDSFTVPPKAPVTKPAATAPATAPSTTQQPEQTPPKTSATTLDKLTAAANSGNAKAELVVALKYLDGDGVPANEAEGAKWLLKAAAQNEPVAEYRLGTLYERGKGVPADASKAARWYLAAAQAGNRKAMHNLAVAYAQGSGMKKDFAEAARWFSKASALGLSDSQFNLAVLYERGLGVPQSLLDAYKWYAIAASQGDTESKSRIDALATQLSADDRAAAQRSASMFRPQQMDRRANVAPGINDVTRG